MWTYITHRVIKHCMFSTKHVIKHRDKPILSCLTLVSRSHMTFMPILQFRSPKPFSPNFSNPEIDPKIRHRTSIDILTTSTETSPILCIERHLSVDRHTRSMLCINRHTPCNRLTHLHDPTVMQVINSEVDPKLYFSTNKIVSFYMLD